MYVYTYMSYRYKISHVLFNRFINCSTLCKYIFLCYINQRELYESSLLFTNRNHYFVINRVDCYLTFKGNSGNGGIATNSFSSGLFQVDTLYIVQPFDNNNTFHHTTLASKLCHDMQVKLAVMFLHPQAFFIARFLFI